MQSLPRSFRALPRLTNTYTSASTKYAPRHFSTTAARPLARMQLIGRLADQAESAPTSTGREITKFAIGVSSGPRDENGNRAVSWFRVASFVEGAQRDLLLSLPKGTQVFIDADARMDTFTAQDGSNRTQLNLLMRNFEALSRPQNRDTAAEPQAEAAAA